MKNFAFSMFFVTAVIFPSVCQAQNQVGKEPQSITFGDPIPAHLAKYSAWTKSKWVNTRDSATQKRWKSIKDAVEHEADAIALAKQWKALSLKSLDDQSLLFSWAVADYEANRYRAIRKMPTLNDIDLWSAFEKMSPPYSYEYMRARFLVSPLNYNGPII